MFKSIPVITVMLAGGIIVSRLQMAAKPANAGQFEYTVVKVHIHRAPGAPGWVEATLGFEIKNAGTVPIQVALVNPTTLQTDAGHRFTVANQEGVSGLSLCSTADVDYCERGAKNYTRLMPGQSLFGSLALSGVRLDGGQLGPVAWARFSGGLFVHELSSGKNWIEPFTVGELKVTSTVP
jgi:hypothetical protein